MIHDFLKQGQLKAPDDLNSLFKDIMKDVIEQCYNTGIKEELGYSKYDYRNEDSKNYHNGYTEKRLKISNDSFDVRGSRDRNSEYTPQLIKKHQNTVGQGLESKIISMYAKGMAK